VLTTVKATDLVRKVAAEMQLKIDVKRLRSQLGMPDVTLGAVLETLTDLPLRDEMDTPTSPLGGARGSMGKVPGSPQPGVAAMNREEATSVQLAIICAYVDRHLSIKQVTTIEDAMSPGSEDWICEIPGLPTLESDLRANEMTGRHLVSGQQQQRLLGTEEMKDVGELFRQTTIEMLYESRVAAMNRLMSFYVLFHAMVEPVARLPLLSYPVDRTPSRLRVASTPAPIPINARVEMKKQEAMAAKAEAAAFVASNNHYLREKKKKPKKKELRKAATITAGSVVNINMSEPPPKYSSPGREAEDAGETSPLLSPNGSDEPISPVMLFSPGSPSSRLGRGLAPKVPSINELPMEGESNGSGSSSGDSGSDVSPRAELHVGKGGATVPMSQFDAELKKAFGRYDFMDSGYIGQEQDVRMIAVNLSFKLGLRVAPGSVEEMSMPPSDNSMGWSRASIKNWYLDRFDVEIKSSQKGITESASEQSLDKSLVKASPRKSTAPVVVQGIAVKSTAPVVPPLSFRKHQPKSGGTKSSMKQRVAERLAAKRAALSARKRAAEQQ